MRSAILGGTSVFSSMSAPLSSAMPASQAVKVEDKGNIDIAPLGQVHRDQCYKNVRNQVQRLKDLMKSQRATGRAQPAPPPPVQHPLPPPPPPPPPANRTWTKRPATGPPPGLAGFRQPPQKQHHLQPAPNAHCTPPPPGMPPVNTSKPPLHPRYSAKPFAARRAAAAEKPSVVCGVCDVWCMSVFHLKQHERGRKHRDKVASIAGEKNVQCQVCNVQLASELNVVQHYAGKQHRQRLQLRGANGTTGNQATWHDDVAGEGQCSCLIRIPLRATLKSYRLWRMRCSLTESIWSEDSREYKPERWLKDGWFMSESAYKFTAFDGGPRLCLGKDFAYYQMKFAAASILHRYRLDVVDGHPVAPKMELTMYMKHGLKVTLTKRRDKSKLSEV